MTAFPAVSKAIQSASMCLQSKACGIISSPTQEVTSKRSVTVDYFHPERHNWLGKMERSLP